jgi:hypothetical protein
MSPSGPAPLPSRRAFAAHLGRNAALAAGVGLTALVLGAVGFHALGHQPWVDASMNASLTLNGVGPVDAIEGTAFKVFVTWYSFFGGLAYLSTVGVFLAPLAQRLMHRLHLALYDADEAAT